MAESKTTMARLAKLERDSKGLKGAIDELGERIDGLGETLSERIDDLRDSLGGRLDRLIAATIQEHTYSVERLASIERRLTRLEERAGI
jgi:hypothetical protein